MAVDVVQGAHETVNRVSDQNEPVQFPVQFFLEMACRKV